MYRESNADSANRVNTYDGPSGSGDGYAAYNVRGMYERDDLSWEQPLTRDSCHGACAAESDMAARTLDQRGGARAGEVLLPVVDNQAVHDVQYNHYLMPNYQYYYPMY